MKCPKVAFNLDKLTKNMFVDINIDINITKYNFVLYWFFFFNVLVKVQFYTTMAIWKSFLIPACETKAIYGLYRQINWKSIYMIYNEW